MWGAFDLHTILVENLKYYGVPQNSCNFIGNYFSYRFHIKWYKWYENNPAEKQSYFICRCHQLHCCHYMFDHLSDEMFQRSAEANDWSKLCLNWVKIYLLRTENPSEVKLLGVVLDARLASYYESEEKIQVHIHSGILVLWT